MPIHPCHDPSCQAEQKRDVSRAQTDLVYSVRSTRLGPSDDPRTIEALARAVGHPLPGSRSDPEWRLSVGQAQDESLPVVGHHLVFTHEPRQSLGLIFGLERAV
jgi:hypothetical protein